MRVEGHVQPDEAIIASTLTACTVLKLLELGREIHCYVEAEVGYTVIIWNTLLDMYAKCGCLASARKIFDEIPIRKVICWTSMILGYVSCGQLDEPRDLFDRTTVKDRVLWTSMANGYVQFNRFDGAVELFQMMQFKGVRPDKVTVVALLVQGGALEQGKWIHGYINENRMPVDTVLGTALIDMYAKCAYTLLANIYASAYRWEDMTKGQRKMKALGVRKLPGCSSIEVDGVIHEFITADLSHPAMVGICYGLERLAVLFGELDSEDDKWERELIS